jgi:glycosyltransferase involved in cell wall biosynthesis
MALPIRVAIITNIIPSYRRDFYQRIFADPMLEATVYCQAQIPGMNLPSVHAEFGNRVVEVPHFTLHREAFGLQFLPIVRLLQGYHVYFIYGNPRVFSNVLLSLLLKMLGKTVVIDGQLHTGGSKKILKNVRLAWWRLFDYIFLYNDSESAQLKQKKGFMQKHILAMNNGLDQEAINAAAAEWSELRLQSWCQQQQLQDRLLLLSCARLESKNHFELMIDALPALRSRYPDLLWAVIGSGSELEELKIRAEGLGVSDMIRWLGPIYDEEQLAPWFLSSRLLVHPGAIGLSLLHAFGYGLPVVTHDNAEQHMPEFACLTAKLNGEVYRYGDLQSMVAAIETALLGKTEMGKNAVELVTSRFNTQVMAHRFRLMSLLAARQSDSQEVDL